MVANLDMVHWATRANQNVLLTHQKSVTGGGVRPTDRFGATRRTSLPQWPVGRSIGAGILVGHGPIPGWRRKAFSTRLPWAFDSSRGWRLPERPGGMGIARSTRAPMARVDGDPGGDRPAGGATRHLAHDLGPRWLLPAFEGALGVALLIANPWHTSESRKLRPVSVGLIAVISAANLRPTFSFPSSRPPDPPQVGPPTFSTTCTPHSPTPPHSARPTPCPSPPGRSCS